MRKTSYVFAEKIENLTEQQIFGNNLSKAIDLNI